jgi:hypothetical protein
MPLSGAGLRVLITSQSAIRRARRHPRIWSAGTASDISRVANYFLTFWLGAGGLARSKADGSGQTVDEVVASAVSFAIAGAGRGRRPGLGSVGEAGREFGYPAGPVLFAHPAGAF